MGEYTKSLRDKVIASSKETIGYAEAENKESFIVGATVSAMKFEELYEKEIERLETNLGMYMKLYEGLRSEVKGISNFLKQFED